MRQRERQRHLFEDNNSVHVPPHDLQAEIAQQATCVLIQWMRTLAKTICAGAGDEQDKR